MLENVGADAPIVTNAAGGQQSKSAYAFHMMDYGALFALAKVLQYGAERYARDNWRKIPAEEHYNHMIIHSLAWLSGDRQDDHLGHMFCRAMMFYATAADEEKAAMETDPSRIIAVDFDGCLCSRAWPEIGEPNLEAIERVKRHRERGGKAILWSCREGESLQAAVDWCRGYGLEFDAVNANLQEQNELYGNDSRKVGADEYWDDKAKVVIAREGND